MFIVFMVVTIQAEQFPVAAIGRIVVVVMVFVMDRKFAKSFPGKLAPAPRTDMRINFESPLSIAFLPKCYVAVKFGKDSRLPFGIQ